MTRPYEPNPLFEEEVQTQAEFQKGMRSITKGVAASVRAVSPHQTGYYERRIKAKGTRVIAGDPFWHLVELGSANNVPYRPLTRGVRAAGLRFVLLPKP
jgi:hypothetical protein